MGPRGRIYCHIANAGDVFSIAEIDGIKSAVKMAEKFISDNFNFDYEVDVIVVRPSRLLDVYPKYGINGRIYNSNLVVVAVDKAATDLENHLFEDLCHEMAHSLRWQKVSERAESLFDDILFEGLALALEEKAISEMGLTNTREFFKEIKAASKPEIDNILEVLGESLGEKNYNYDEVFFDGNEKLPLWAGYKLGYYLVGEYLRATSGDIVSVALEGYEELRLKISSHCPGVKGISLSATEV